MSHYVSRLKLGGRDLVSNWPSAPGAWKLNENVNRLAAFAAALEVPSDSVIGDSLKSVPSPWARLLLFESALFNPAHLAHEVTLGQWRGLLGLFALARSLRLQLTATAVRLQDHATDPPHQGELAKSFIDLNPGLGEVEDRDDNRWNYFYIVSIDNVDIACTSPRTLLFSRTSAAMPLSIPFQENGVLIDPVKYYRKYDDKISLGLIRSWLTSFLANVEQSARLDMHLGRAPAALGAVPTRRKQLIIEELQRWAASINSVEMVTPDGPFESPFGGPPYSDVLTLLPAYQFDRGGRTPRSDLQLDGKLKALVAFDRSSSRIFNSAGAELQTEQLKVFDGRWTEADKPLPLPFTFAAPDYRTVIASDLFEPALIPVTLPASSTAVYALTLDTADGVPPKHFLLPFKKEILELLDAAVVHRSTRITFDRARNRYTVELSVPLVGRRTIRVLRTYALDVDVVNDAFSQEVAMWPNFSSPHWRHYFYFKSSVRDRQVVLEPVQAGVERRADKAQWMYSNTAVEAFVGTIDQKSGLLPIRHDGFQQFGAPTDFWRAGVDFGSTHTRVFYALLDSARPEGRARKTINPVEFQPRTVAITYCDPGVLQHSFFSSLDLEIDSNQQLKSVLMVPSEDAAEHPDWLPREGFVYMAPLYAHSYDASYLRQNLKWDSRTNNYDLRSFLRGLLTMVEAEAFANGATVVDVVRSYPSVFTQGLLAKQRTEWAGLRQYLNRDRSEGRRVRCDTELTETVAVCRHLELQGAPVAANTIVLDVGGSTTDIAVWAAGKLLVQESVKMAGGLIGRCFETDRAATFRGWLEALVKRAPFGIEKVESEKFERDPGGLSLLFHSLLSTVEKRQLTKELRGEVMTAKESSHLLAHNVYLFASLFYYAGLLARKANLEVDGDAPIYIYVCGRGGQFLNWVASGEILGATTFRSGFLGREASADTIPPIDVVMSRLPKEEVGRGLLAESILTAYPRENGIGMLRLTAPSVTVAETGYGSLAWDGELNGEILQTFTQSMLPQKAQLHELNTFSEMFMHSNATREAADILGIAAVNDARYRDRLISRLFGQARGGVIRDIRDDPSNALIEPLLITELKVLLEAATNNPALFSDGD